MSGQYLKLTEYEKQWNNYYSSPDGRRGVLSRRHSGTARLDGGKLRDVITFNAVRRSRLYKITFAGDVWALKIQCRLGTGAAFQLEPVHIPLLCGASSYSTLLLHPTIYGPDYPSQGIVAENSVPQVSRPWAWVLDPNIVIPNAQGLVCEISLENVDAGIPEGGFYALEMVFHHWQFPGFEGGP